jgi:probable rRNA maturation factor
VPAVVHRRAKGSLALDPRLVCRIADRMLVAIDRTGAELSVLLTDDATIRELNARYRSKDKATDVLAFPMAEADNGSIPPDVDLLGDVVISLDTAAKQARERRHDLVDEVTHLLAHGLLHLVGHDHQTDAEERRMDAETRRLVMAAGRRKRAKST